MAFGPLAMLPVLEDRNVPIRGCIHYNCMFILKDAGH